MARSEVMRIKRHAGIKPRASGPKMQVRMTTKKSTPKGPSVGPVESAIHREFVEIWEDCAAAAIDAILSELRTSGKHGFKDTGMTMASFAPIGRMVNASGLSGLVGSKVGSFYGSGKTKKGRNTSGRARKSAALGRTLGDRAIASGKHRISFGSPQRPKAFFRLDVLTIQHQLGVKGFVKGHGRLQTVQVGRAAFKSTYNSRIKRIPKIALKVILQNG